jgi:hypothetical protein
MKREYKNKRGQMFVGMILLIGSIVAVVGLMLLFLSGSLVGTSYGIKAQAVAQGAATAGAEDALLQVERNSFASFPVTYTLPVGSTTATISVNTNTPSSGFVTVTSSATFSNHLKVLRVVLSVSSSTQVNVVSWTQVQ